MASKARSPPLDWPLSSEEKKGCVLRLFDKDVRAANEVIRSSEEKLLALQQELDDARECRAEQAEMYAIHTHRDEVRSEGSGRSSRASHPESFSSTPHGSSSVALQVPSIWQSGSTPRRVTWAVLDTPSANSDTEDEDDDDDDDLIADGVGEGLLNSTLDRDAVARCLVDTQTSNELGLLKSEVRRLRSKDGSVAPLESPMGRPQEQPPPRYMPQGKASQKKRQKPKGLKGLRKNAAHRNMAASDPQFAKALCGVASALARIAAMLEGGGSAAPAPGPIPNGQSSGTGYASAPAPKAAGINELLERCEGIAAHEESMEAALPAQLEEGLAKGCQAAILIVLWRVCLGALRLCGVSFF